MSIFVERLKEYMADEQWTISALAAKLNCSRATLSGILNGAHLPSTGVLIALVELFHCSADYLLGLIEYPREVTFGTCKPFGNILRKCLIEKNCSEYRLQKDLRLSHSVTYRWLTNQAVPSVDSLIKLSKYFSCSVDFLLGRES